jgi:hypothetical protein
MPNMNISFQGATLSKPGAYEADQPTGVNPNPALPVPPLVFIGYGYGGKPATPYTFDSVAAWQAFLRGGPCGMFAPVLDDPSPALNGAQQITYFNASENTQSMTGLIASGMISNTVFTSVNYGSPSNQLQLSATPVYNGAGINITLYDGYSGEIESQDNVGVPLQAGYIGMGTYGMIEFADPEMTGAPTEIILTDAGATVATLQIGPSGYTTASELYEYLIGSLDFTGNIIGDGTVPLADFDIGSYMLPAPVAGAVQYVTLTASWNGPVYWANQYASDLVTAVRGNTHYPAVGGIVFETVTSQHFSGAVSVPPTTQDYANCLNASLMVPGWVLVLDTDDTDVIALASENTTQASSTVMGRWRRFFTGSPLGETVSGAVSEAQAINNKSVCYAYPGISVTNPTTGVTTMYGGYMAGAAAAAIACGNNVAQPLTNQQLQAVDVEVAISDTDLDTLQQGGVMPVMPDSTNIPRIISDYTTWQADADPLNVFTQQIACRYWVAYTLVSAAQPYVGTIAAPLDEVKILNAAKKALNGLVQTSANTNNAVLASWDATSLQLVYTGANQTAAISVNVTIVGQNRFITIFVPVQTYSATTTLSSN